MPLSFQEDLVRLLHALPITPQSAYSDEQAAVPLSFRPNHTDGEEILISGEIVGETVPAGFLMNAALEVFDRYTSAISNNENHPLSVNKFDEHSKLEKYEIEVILNVMQTFQALLGEDDATFQIIHSINISEKRILAFLDDEIPHSTSAYSHDEHKPFTYLFSGGRKSFIPIRCLCDALYYSLANYAVNGTNLQLKRCPVCGRPFFSTKANKQYCPYFNQDSNDGTCKTLARYENNRLTKTKSRYKNEILALIDSYEQDRFIDSETAAFLNEFDTVNSRTRAKADTPNEQHALINKWLREKKESYRIKYAEKIRDSRKARRISS